MPPFAWVGAAAAALVASVFIMLKGSMVERPRRMPVAEAGPGSPSGYGIPELGTEEEDPFKRFPRPRESRGLGPAPTQTETGMLSNSGGGWGSDDAEPAWSYESAGDGNGGAEPAYAPSIQSYIDRGYVPVTSPAEFGTQPGNPPAVETQLVGGLVSIYEGSIPQRQPSAPAPAPSTRIFVPQ